MTALSAAKRADNSKAGSRCRCDATEGWLDIDHLAERGRAGGCVGSQG
jgi:hypothetical protein